MRLTMPFCGVVGIVVAIVLLATLPLAWSTLSVQAGLRYTVEQSGYDNSVRVGNASLMPSPRIVTGPPNANGTRALYVIGVNQTNSASNNSTGCLPNSLCGPLVVVPSSDGGQSFAAPELTETGALGWSVDALALPNGTLVAASWGPWIFVSRDSGGTWNKTAALGNVSTPASIALDPVTGTLYAVWSPVVVWELIPGQVYMSSSRDGGYHWSQPVMILPWSPGAWMPEVAAYRNHIVAAFRYGTVPTYIGAMTSSDGGRTWSNVSQVSMPVGNSTWSAAVDTNPSVAVSSSGTFAVAWYRDTRNYSACTPASCDLSPTTAVLVSTSNDDGSSWSAPITVAAPPGYLGVFSGHSAVFDSSGRLYVGWATLSSDRMDSTLYVASSDRSVDQFTSASFCVTFETSVSPGLPGAETLAAGGNGSVYLAWESRSPDGIYVRTVAGAVSGTVSASSGNSEVSPVIQLRDAATGSVVREARWKGSAVVFTDLAPGDYALWYESGNTSINYGILPVEAWGLTSFTIQTGPPPILAPLAWAAGAALAAAILLLAATHSIVLYTRLTKDNVLQRQIRALMYGYIRDHPGSSFAVIRDTLGLQNGAAEYHLAVLEDQGFLHSEFRRGHRWYYPNGDVSLWKDIPLSPMQQAIVDAVRNTPGLGIRDISRKIGRRASSVAYNVKGLAREGVIREDRNGRKVRYFAAEGTRDAST